MDCLKNGMAIEVFFVGGERMQKACAVRDVYRCLKMFKTFFGGHRKTASSK